LSPKYKKCRKIPREFDLTAVQGHNNNNNIRLIRRCQNATCYNDMENSQET